MPLTPRQKAIRLAKIRRIIMRLYPSPPAELAEAEDEQDEELVAEAPVTTDMATLPPTSVDAAAAW